MIIPGLTLVTYTYNDARLVHGLLRHVKTWTATPESLLVVDDGSEPRFSLENNWGEVLRLDENQGPAGAKYAGITAAMGEYVLSMDCDVRPHPGWLERAFPLARDQKVGLVGGVVIWDAGENITSRYLKHFGNYRPDKNNPQFLSGEIWLMRKQVWNRVEGFGDDFAPMHEDYLYSKRVLAAGYRLELFSELPVREVRLIGRLDMVKRDLAYMVPAMTGAVAKQGPQALLPLVTRMIGRVDEILELGDLGLVYVEMLLLCSCLVSVSQPQRGLEPGVRARVAVPAAETVSRLTGYPRVHETLLSDLGNLGLEPPPDTGAQGGDVVEITGELMDLLHRQGLLVRLEKILPEEIAREDAIRDFDFHYIR